MSEPQSIGGEQVPDPIPTSRTDVSKPGLVIAVIALALALIGMIAFPGPVGDDGAQGEIGPQGLTGDDGDDGNDGAQGPTGPQGLSGVNGTDGVDGVNGTDGVDGVNGIACWDLNGNGTGDIPAEDINGDLVVDVLDCTGPQGLQGDPGPQGPSGVVTSAFATGFGNDPTLTTDFLAPYVTVNVVSGQSVFVVSHKAFGSFSPGGADSLRLDICYRTAGSVVQPTTVGGGIFDLAVPQNTRIPMGMSTIIGGLSTGSWEVGLCGESTLPANWNNNEYGYTSAIVFQT